MKKLLLLALMMGMASISSNAQRVIDKLDRGLVAVKTTGGVFVSWRIQSDEYYDVTYNLYRNGSLVAENLKTSNYTDAAGTTTSSYTVEAVKQGIKSRPQVPLPNPGAMIIWRLRQSTTSPLPLRWCPMMPAVLMSTVTA